MSGKGDSLSEIDSFLESWQGENEPMCQWYSSLYQELLKVPEVQLEFMARPGVSYSIRPKLSSQKERGLFAIVDVIDDDPAERWLSVCFYEDMITDPQERGELIPGGLAGGDGYCFDMFDDDAEAGEYLLARLREAAKSAHRF